MTLIFYDWEFYENGSTIEPISLGMVTEDGRKLYLVNQDFNWDAASYWLKENVKPQLFTPELGLKYKKHRYEVKANAIGTMIYNWLLARCTVESPKVRLVGYYADYDHVLLAQQFGTMMQLPKHIPMWTCDLKQWCHDLGDPRLPNHDEGEHNALADAVWIAKSYNWLTQNYDHPAWAPSIKATPQRHKPMEYELDQE